MYCYAPQYRTLSLFATGHLFQFVDCFSFLSVNTGSYLQWVLKLTCEYSKLILSKLSNTTTTICFLCMWYVSAICLYRCIFSPAWEDFPHRRIMNLKLMTTGSQKSYGIALGHGDVLATHLHSQKCHLQLHEHSNTKQLERTKNCAHRLHIFQKKIIKAFKLVYHEKKGAD